MTPYFPENLSLIAKYLPLGRKKIAFIVVMLLALLFTNHQYAANYYWRATTSNDVFTNVANWETTPGGGSSPSVAPSSSDNVFFPSTMVTPLTINLNGGICNNFSFLASANVTFNGSITINGSLTANGNAYFHIVGSSSYTSTSGNTLTFTGTGNHTIDMGTDERRFTGGGGIFFSSSSLGGTYSLVNHNFLTENTIRLVTQNFYSNGKTMDVLFMTSEGTVVRSINLANSTINVLGNISTYSDNLFSFDLRSTTATYDLADTRIVAKNTTIFQLVVDVPVTIGSLTLNNGGTSVVRTFLGGMNLTMDSLIINNTGLYLGTFTLGGTGTAVQSLNVGVIQFKKHSKIENYANTTINSVHTILEAPFCNGQSSIQSLHVNTLKFNTSASVNTNSLAYRAVQFGGSGVQTSSSNNLGFNTGSVVWTGSLPSTTFYWVGGDGNWSDPTQWSVVGSGGTPQLATGCIPTYTDNVVFDHNSFTANQVVSIGSEGAYCKDITFTDPAKEGLIQAVSNGFALNIYGSAQFSGARGIGNNVFLNFLGSGTHTITSGSNFTYNSRQILMLGTGSYTLTDSFKADMNASSFLHLSGSWNTNGQVMVVYKFISKSHPSLPNNLRNLNIVNSKIFQHGGVQFGDPFINASYLSSFLASGSHITQSANQGNFLVNATLASSSPFNLSPIEFNDLSFISPNGTSTLQTALPIDVSISYNNIHFETNADIVKGTSNNPFFVDTFWLTSGNLYRFTENRTFSITGAIHHITSSCEDLVRINSMNSGAIVSLDKVTAPFQVNNAVVKDVNAIGTTMTVMGGQNAGNNTNVVVTPTVGREMYWVNGAGNWSDGLGHWSIGLSGGSPSVTNPSGCIPRLVDNVYFDANSFSAPSQTVQLDIDAECKNMTWTPDAGNNTPLLAGASVRVLSVWGALELASGMTSPFNGAWNMMGSSLSVNDQSIRSNGVVLNSFMSLTGGGRYDLLDAVNYATGIALNSGHFYSNAHNLTLANLYLDVRSPNFANISNSNIVLNSSRLFPGSSTFYSYYAHHSGTGNWNALGSTILSNSREFVVNSTVPVAYDTIIMNTLGNNSLYLTSAQPLTANWIEWKTLTSNTSGNITTGTLIYQQSSTNNLQANRTVLVTDSLVAYGTPCLPVNIKSATAGIQATLNSGNCRFDILFGNFSDIRSTTCLLTENKVVGNNSGNNTNWTFTSVSSFTPMGNDTTIVCRDIPVQIDASGFSNFGTVAYSWNTGATTPQITTDTGGIYVVTVDYGASCFINDTLIVTCSATLPLELTSFGGYEKDCNALLTWTTAKEDNVKHIIVEQSTDAQLYTAAATVRPLGNNSRYSVAIPQYHTSFYRLKIVDVDGSLSYSNVVSIKSSCQPDALYTIYPNPAQDYVSIQGLNDEVVTAQLFNATGQLVVTAQVSNADNKIDIRSLNTGVYLLLIAGSNDQFKLVVSK